MINFHPTAGLSSNAQRVVAATFMAGLGASAFALLFNLYLLSLGYQTDFVGLVAAVSTISTALSGPLVFSLNRRFSFGTLLTAGFALQAIGCCGQVLGVGPAFIVAFAAVVGLSQGLYWAPLPPYLAENSTPGDRARLFSINNASLLVAGVAGYILSGQAPAILERLFGLGGTEGYRTTLLAIALLSGLAVLPMLGARSRALQHVQPQPGDPATAARPSRQERARVKKALLVMGVSALSMGIATGLAYPFINVYFVLTHEAATGAVGVIFAASAILSTAATLAAPALQRRIGYVSSIAITRVGTGIGLIGMTLAGSLPAAVLAFWARNAMVQVQAFETDAFGMSAVTPSTRGLQAALTSATWHGGYGLTSLAAGFAIMRIGFEPAFGLAAFVCIVNALLFWLYFRSWPTTQ